MDDKTAQEIWDGIGRDNDDRSAAKRHLSAGRPIYVSQPDYPGEIVRICPDGRRQIVQISDQREISIVREVEPVPESARYWIK